MGISFIAIIIGAVLVFAIVGAIWHFTSKD